MDDALTLDNLKTLKAADQAADIELQSADALENSSGQAAPGSAPFLTATAITSAMHAQALTQKLLAAELRQEAMIGNGGASPYRRRALEGGIGEVHHATDAKLRLVV